MQQQFDFTNPQGIQQAFASLQEKIQNLTTENQQLKQQLKQNELLKAEIYDLKEKIANIEGTLYKVGSLFVSKSSFQITNCDEEEQKKPQNSVLQQVQQQQPEKFVDYGSIFNQITCGSIKENLRLMHEQGIVHEKVKFSTLKKYQSRGFWFLFKEEDKPISAIKYIADLCLKVIDFTGAEDSLAMVEQYALNGVLDKQTEAKQEL